MVCKCDAWGNSCHVAIMSKSSRGKPAKEKHRLRETQKNGIKTPIKFSLPLDFSITYQPDAFSLIWAELSSTVERTSKVKSKIMTLRQPSGPQKHAHWCTSYLVPRVLVTATHAGQWGWRGSVRRDTGRAGRPSLRGSSWDTTLVKIPAPGVYFGLKLQLLHLFGSKQVTSLWRVLSQPGD